VSCKQLSGPEKDRCNERSDKDDCDKIGRQSSCVFHIVSGIGTCGLCTQPV
jgi:hypothetical protein